MVATVSPNICDVSALFKDFEYNVSSQALSEWLSGIGFGRKEPYTKEEFQRLCEDINTLYQNIVSKNPEKGKSAIITAGGPGVGKTTLLERTLKQLESEGRSIAYTDPDAVCLKNQTKSFLADVAALGEVSGSEESIAARKAIYDKWRPGSNAAAHLILANLIKEGYSFALGSTSSGGLTSKQFEYLTEKGYEITLIHVSSPADNCFASIRERDKTFVQTTLEDTQAKALLAPQRISDAYLKYAKRIEFHYRDQVDGVAELAATWIRREEEEKGDLIIHSQESYEKIKRIHDAVIEQINKPELSWENTVEFKSSR